MTAGTDDVIALEIRRDFQPQAANTSQKYKAVDSSHNVADLTELLFEKLFLLCLG